MDTAFYAQRAKAQLILEGETARNRQKREMALRQQIAALEADNRALREGLADSLVMKKETVRSRQSKR
jgi:hypothetical protein